MSITKELATKRRELRRVQRVLVESAKHRARQHRLPR